MNSRQGSEGSCKKNGTSPGGVRNVQGEESADRERRRKNQIIFNIPESTNEQGIEREKEDVDMCYQVFGDVLKVKRSKIEKVRRLGRKQERKVRPTLVRLEASGRCPMVECQRQNAK